MACFFLYNINTNIYHFQSMKHYTPYTGNTRKYHQIDVYIYQCDDILYKNYSCNFSLKYSGPMLFSLILGNFVILLQAANPGCVLEDFVRWYSPRDWVEEKIVNSDGSVASKGR